MTADVVGAMCRTTPPNYREAAVLLWGEDGALMHDIYDQHRAAYLPDLPPGLPMVISEHMNYGACRAHTSCSTVSAPRITLWSKLFRRRDAGLSDTVLHEMLHASLHLAGLDPGHAGRDWYDAVRRLSPAVLGVELEITRGMDRKSKRIPHPDGSGRTTVTKVRVGREHDSVTRWPDSYRERGFDEVVRPIAPTTTRRRSPA